MWKAKLHMEGYLFIRFCNSVADDLIITITYEVFKPVPNQTLNYDNYNWIWLL